MIIGITGTLGAGKGTVVEYLKQKGFKHYSMSNYITEKVVERGLTINRDSMVLVANDLRKEHGPAYIAEQVYEIAKKESRDCVIESLRTEGEIKSLKEKDAFYLFAVDAHPRIRYDRIIDRKSSKDNISFERFLEQEKTEFESVNPANQNLKRCIELADYLFENNGTIPELHSKIEEVLNNIGVNNEKSY